MPDLNPTIDKANIQNRTDSQIIPFPLKKKSTVVRKDDGAHVLALMVTYYATLARPGDQDLIKFFIGGGGVDKVAGAIREAPGREITALRQFADTL